MKKEKILICEVHATGLIWAINPDFGPFNNYDPEARLILGILQMSYFFVFWWVR
jgi:hypothetical protein